MMTLLTRAEIEQQLLLRLMDPSLEQLPRCLFVGDKEAARSLKPTLGPLGYHCER